MRIVLAGASGYLGTALRRHLGDNGHELTQLVRGAPTNAVQVRWDPYNSDRVPELLDGADVVVNLAGAPIAHWPWTSSYKRKLLDSRVVTTATLSDTIAMLESKPALVNASGVDYYGADRGDEELAEDSGRGSGLLADVADRWEAATHSAREAGGRVAIMRTAPVLGPGGGVLSVIARPFKLGGGATLGSGKQWFSSVSLDDYVRAVTRLITDDSMSGAYNLSAPQPVTNADFTTALGRQLHRPTLLKVPGFAMKAAAGELAMLVLGSRRVLPRRLLTAGFEFEHPTIELTLAAALS